MLCCMESRKQAGQTDGVIAANPSHPAARRVLQFARTCFTQFGPSQIEYSSDTAHLHLMIMRPTSHLCQGIYPFPPLPWQDVVEDIDPWAPKPKGKEIKTACYFDAAIEEFFIDSTTSSRTS